METHADLIAGLPLYHLSEIFDDVRTFSRVWRRRNSTESLKLLPGTEMKRRADELGIQYSNYPAEVEAKIQKYRKQGYKLPPRKVLRTPEQLEGIRESAKINTALLDYISENIREGMSTEEIDVMVYDFTTKHGAIPAPLNYEVVCHGIPSKTEILQSGDIINVDVSTIYNGYFSDASRMFMIGDVSPEMRKLVQVTKECMEIGIAAAHLGNN